MSEYNHKNTRLFIFLMLCVFFALTWWANGKSENRIRDAVSQPCADKPNR